jgi:putative phosphoesterase
MTRIGLLSDTHGYLPEKAFSFISDCDEIWHAGDIGSLDLLHKLESTKLLRAVFGNIDGREIRSRAPERQLFLCEKVKVLMVHIGGYPGKYEKNVLPVLKKEKPDLFISGHSHILKVIYDKKNNLLHINPGAAGRQGLHKAITLVRFEIDGKEIRNLEIFESPRTIE